MPKLKRKSYPIILRTNVNLRARVGKTEDLEIRVIPTTLPTTPQASNQEESEPGPDPLAPLLAVAGAIVRELERDARALGALKKGEPFPRDRARELREKIVWGMCDWAIRRMGADLKKYLEEGQRNFLHLFKLHYMEHTTIHDRFWGPFEKTRFFIPLKRGSRRIVHHSEWPMAWEIYRDTLPIFQKIHPQKRRSDKCYLLALKENFPGVPDDEAKKIWQLEKPSDAALEYVRWKLKIDSVGVEALREYFKVFHKPYGYFDFMTKDLFSKVK
jgi:hypothetical protein